MDFELFIVKNGIHCAHVLHARTEQRPMCRTRIPARIPCHSRPNLWNGSRLVYTGAFVAGATDLIEDNKTAFDLLTYVGALYIAYLSYKIATSKALEKGEESSERLGFVTGATIQIVNGKAWIHFLVLMTSFGTLFGTGFTGKILLVLLNLAFGLPAVMSWAAFGTVLRRAFTTPKSAKALNLTMGLSLFVVAIWVALPH